MRIANIDGRAHLVADAGGCDIEVASAGHFSGEPQVLLGVLDDLARWVARADPKLDPQLSVTALAAHLDWLDAPVPDPSQVFAIGLNYGSHADETGLARPEVPMVFTKFPSSLAGPGDSIRIASPTVDWEVELVVVIGRGGRDIPAARALEHVAGYCVGQDLSDRTLQFASTPPQFSLAKSAAGYAPIGPWLTTADELGGGDLAAAGLGIGCGIDGEAMQSGNTRDLIFGVPALVEYLSHTCALRPGDLVFTGTPSGVGYSRKPPRFLQPGTRLESSIEGLGALRNPLVA